MIKVRLAMVEGCGLACAISHDGKRWDYFVDCAALMKGECIGGGYVDFPPIPYPGTVTLKSWGDLPQFAECVHVASYTWRDAKGSEYTRLWGDDATLRVTGNAMQDALDMGERVYVRDGEKAARAYLEMNGITGHKPLKNAIALYHNSPRVQRDRKEQEAA